MSSRPVSRERNVYPVSTLLHLSQSPLVYVPNNLIRLEEWYGSRKGVAEDGSHFDQSRRPPGAAKGAATPPAATTARARGAKGERDASDTPMAWRRGAGDDASARGGQGRTPGGSMPAWMDDEPTRAEGRAPGAGKMDSIQEFKAQMREKERREKGLPMDAPASATPTPADDDGADGTDGGVYGHASRFARFFDKPSGETGARSAAPAGGAPVSVDPHDLFHMFQKGGASRGVSAAQSASATPPSGHVATERNGGGMDDAASQTHSPAARAAAQQPARSNPATSAAATTPPTAADMERMQMLMAKLMGGAGGMAGAKSTDARPADRGEAGAEQSAASPQPRTPRAPMPPPGLPVPAASPAGGRPPNVPVGAPPGLPSAHAASARGDEHGVPPHPAQPPGIARIGIPPQQPAAGAGAPSSMALLHSLLNQSRPRDEPMDRRQAPQGDGGHVAQAPFPPAPPGLGMPPHAYGRPMPPPGLYPGMAPGGWVPGATPPHGVDPRLRSVAPGMPPLGASPPVGLPPGMPVPPRAGARPPPELVALLSHPSPGAPPGAMPWAEPGRPADSA
ncbi:hypothetical protein MSPP1_003887 [Malassezia sp. CBS 17886]|nr:hypothetical protein MSPP1_003887 [Malassezia sp. CBS 17886]